MVYFLYLIEIFCQLCFRGSQSSYQLLTGKKLIPRILFLLFSSIHKNVSHFQFFLVMSSLKNVTIFLKIHPGQWHRSRITKNRQALLQFGQAVLKLGQADPNFEICIIKHPLYHKCFNFLSWPRPSSQLMAL